MNKLLRVSLWVLALSAVFLAARAFLADDVLPLRTDPIGVRTTASMRESIDRELQSGRFGGLVALKSALPEEYERFLNEAAAMTAEGASDEEVWRRSAEAMAEIRQRHAATLARAPDAELVDLLRSWREVHQVVLQKRGPVFCARMAAEGSAALGQGGTADFMDEMNAHAADLFTAIAAAGRAPVNRTAPEEADTAALLALHAEAGGGEDDLARLSSNDAADPELCPAIDRFLQALIEVPGDGGARLRAQVAVAVAAAPAFR